MEKLATDSLKEIRPTRRLTDLERLSYETVLDIGRAFETIKAGIEETLKSFDLSGPQYHVLRLLRDAGTEGATCQEIADGLIKRDPDVTRLLDRLEGRGLAVRRRSPSDRRVVRAYLTEEGLSVVEKLDLPLMELHLRQVGHLGPDQLCAMSRALRAICEENG